jgi:hypothetical protein
MSETRDPRPEFGAPTSDATVKPRGQAGDRVRKMAPRPLIERPGPGVPRSRDPAPRPGRGAPAPVAHAARRPVTHPGARTTVVGRHRARSRRARAPGPHP